MGNEGHHEPFPYQTVVELETSTQCIFLLDKVSTVTLYPLASRIQPNISVEDRSGGGKVIKYPPPVMFACTRQGRHFLIVIQVAGLSERICTLITFDNFVYQFPLTFHSSKADNVGSKLQRQHPALEKYG